MIESIIEDLAPLWKKKFALPDFFSVKAPERVYKDAYIINENNHLIDCNIYHPKYGYPGKITQSSSKRLIYIPVNRIWKEYYTDPATGENIFCENYFPILCISEDGTLTNKDGEKVFRKDSVLSQTRLAENEKDFEEIYQREIEAKGLQGKEFSGEVFKNELIAHLEKLITDYKEVTKYDEVNAGGSYIETLSIADKFKNWINIGKGSPDVSGDKEGIINPQGLMKEDATLALLTLHENSLSDQISSWRNGKQVEFCAAYCIYLINKRMFKSNSRKTAIQFARLSYNIDITSSFDKLKKANNSTLLDEKINKINRLISNKYYGKIQP